MAEKRKFVNSCQFGNLRVLKVNFWSHGAVLLRCYQGGNGDDDGAYISIFVEDGVEAGLDLKAGQYINVQNARVRTKDTDVPLVEALKRSKLKDRNRTVEPDVAYYAERLGLDETQTRRLRGLVKRTLLPKGIVEFVVRAADVEVAA